MGAKSFIVRGKGNADSFCSCSHGAGRVMSRNEARKLISVEQHIADTYGVECRKDSEVVDESPKAYKNIDDVMKSQEDLVEIVATLKQILCVKG
jgi:tRNA-splicing ligase RtcB